MKKTELFLENRIKWKASQHNIPNKNVFFFENLNEKVTLKYLSHINENDTGKLILLFTNSKKIWTILGTKMIIGYDGTKLNLVKLSSIKDANSKNFIEQNFKSKRVWKWKENKLSIIDYSRNETIFFTKKGKDFFSLWSIILMIIRLNKSKVIEK